jgi:hypothetical protein
LNASRSLSVRPPLKKSNFAVKELFHLGLERVERAHDINVYVCGATKGNQPVSNVGEETDAMFLKAPALCF